MLTLKSLAVGSGLLAGVTGLTCLSCYAAGLFNTNTQITTLLGQENKYTLLSFESAKEQEEWTKALKKYKDDNRDLEKDKWNVDGWKKEDVVEVPQGFKTACSKRKNNKVNCIEDYQYKEFTRYCTRTKTIEEFLKTKKFKALNSVVNENIWTNKFNSYKNSNVQFSDLFVPKTGNEKTFADLKKECEKGLNLRINDSKYSQVLPIIKSWCLQ